MFPKSLAGCLVKAEDPLLTGERLLAEGVGGQFRTLGELQVGDIDTTAGDGRARIAGADGRAPANLGTSFWEVCEDSGLPPDTVALGAKPLRPIIRAGWRGKKCNCQGPDGCRTRSLSSH